MGIDASKSANRNRSLTVTRRKAFRSLICENLERRELMAAVPIFDRGTDQSYVDRVTDQLANLGAGGGAKDGNSPMNLIGSRWTNPTGGPSPNMGDTATISWSIVPDGTKVSTLAGGLAASNLISRMDTIYGGGVGPVANRPWFNIIQRAYDTWAAESGLNYKYEPNDDGADYSDSARGIIGVRGDVRIGGNDIDGNSGVLAFNFYPNGSGNSGTDGDMVIDTNDNFFSQNSDGPTGENRGLFNVLMHEAGHGLGLGHVIPINQTKLMEPFVSFQFLGAQYDDILAAQTLYGDNDEPSDTVATAFDLGALDSGTTLLTQRSIDRNADVDLFKFNIADSATMSLTISPDGRQYVVGPDGGATAPVDTFLNKDLSFQIEKSNGQVLKVVSAAQIGLPEVLSNFDLTSAGTYVIRVLGVGPETQAYTLNLTLAVNQTPKIPRLLSVSSNSSGIFSTTSPNVLSESPRELLFRFDTDLDAATLKGGIKITGAGGDGQFGASSPAADSVISPAYLSFVDPTNRRVVVARFAQPLPDDLYHVEIFGVDIPSQNIVAIRNTAGVPLQPRRANTDRDTYDFNLELGTKITAVVPQPIDRIGNVLSQRRKDIEIYFNDSELYDQVVTTGNVSPNPSVVDPQFYSLILTKDSVSPTDDAVFSPNSITYDPVAKKATLTFASNIDQLPGVNGSGTFRLRVGSTFSNTAVVNQVVPAADPAGTISGVAGVANTDLGLVSGSFSTIISQEIRTVSNPLLSDFPGSNFEPGHRDIQDESHLGIGSADGSAETATIFYSFMDNQTYGNDINGRPLFSSITPDQRQRVREVMEFYSAQLGLDIVEKLGPAGSALKIVVGDMAPNGKESGPGDVTGVADQSKKLAIMDGAEAWDNSFGLGSNVPGTANFFTVAMHEIGHLLGYDHTYDLPPSTIMGSEGALSSNPLESVFPGNEDVIHGQNLYRPDNRDVDLYKFTVAAGAKGQLRAETIAERLNDSSTLDSYLTLYRKNADGTLTIVSANDNYFSDDSLLTADLAPGEYYISVTAKGNENNDPLVLNSGSGGVSQGKYQLRIDFKSTVSNQIVEETRGSTAKGSALDGDGDGIAGGNFDFWFRAASPNDPLVPPPVRTLFVDKAYTGATKNGSLLAPFTLIQDAVSQAKPGDIIRLVGDNRTPNNLRDDNAYEIGTGGASGGALKDGATLDVPRGVTLMIDAGAILKFGGSKILVGSNDSTTNRSNAAIQVLGLPSLPVYFTSYNDESLGKDTNPLVTTPAQGNWGGIEIRNDFDRAQGRVDREREGIFLNTISNADIRYGGGQVGKVVSPIDLSEARPLILGNKISFSADSAISADPNSFEETLFTEPRYQAAGDFVPDYSRIGPDIRGNTLSNNSVNGLFVRIDTLPGQPTKSLSVPGRINDSEVTIVLGENLTVEGTPGGPVDEVIAPDITLLTLNRVAPTSGSGFASAISAKYLVTYVDRFGQESLPSAAVSINVLAGEAVKLNNLPVATLDYVSRRVWRQENNTGAFKLAGVLNRDDTSFVDNGVTLIGALQTQGMTEIKRARRDASLVIDPGVVIKSSGGIIDVGMSSTLLAEGTESKPIVFTSRKDDRYGAAGTFDTNNDSTASSPAAGDWAGIVTRHLGQLSIDHSLITFGGGVSRGISYNAIEVHQSVARIANSVIESNDSGISSPSTSNRLALGNNDGAAIYIVGSQPVLLNNIIRNNGNAGTAAISIDANSLNTEHVSDYGRSVGSNDREVVGIGNSGPLVSNNQLGGNALNGMRIRGATLTTESVWDDTDIVHILQSTVVVPDFHTYGGLRLQSKADESLVVKLSNGGGFTAEGRPLDIMDRIGGSIQLLGSPGFPVVLTSLSDDTIGAGFDDAGKSLVDTNNNGVSVGKPGDWRSVLFTPLSNDRNVDITYERESDQLSGDGTNDFPSNAQSIGQLASSLNGGDENLRLGVSVTGSIAAPSDLDVYSFTGTAGTMVWFDIDQTSGSLDTIVELVDGNGQIIAQSDNSIDESTRGNVFFDSGLISTIRAWPMDQEASAKLNKANGTPIDFQGVNPLDAGFRAILPGVAGSTNGYFIRVRSSNVTPSTIAAGQVAVDTKLHDPGAVRQGITVGGYRLQLRLQQTDEIPGSTVRFADIRFASTGIDAQGQPMHSQLVGEVAEQPVETPDNSAVPQPIGNILSNDRAGVSISGSFNAGDNIDYYSFSVKRDSIQQVSDTPQSHTAVTFDVDYADGLGRGNTQLWIYQVVGGQRVLVATADDSNILDDQPAANQGTDQTDLTRGSLGKRDAYIGPIELPQGDYVVAVTNKSKTHVAFSQFTNSQGNSSSGLLSKLVRVEPIDSVSRISEDRFDSLVSPARPTVSDGAEMVAFNTSSIVPYNFSDVNLFSAVGRQVNFANPLTGVREATYSTDGFTPVQYGPNGNSLTDIAVNPGGFGVGYQRTFGGTDGNSGNFVPVDVGNGGLNGAGSVLNTYSSGFNQANPPAPIVFQSNVGMVFDGLTFAPVLGPDSGTQSFWGVARRGGGTQIQPVLDNNQAIVGLGPNGITKNILYELSTYNGTVGSPQNSTGATRANGQVAFGAGTQVIENGYFVKSAGTTVRLGFQAGRIDGFVEADGTVTGLAYNNSTSVAVNNSGARLYAVTNQGELMSMRASITTQQWSDFYTVINDANGNPIQFTGLAAGPRNLVEGSIKYSDLLFGVTATGRMYAFNTDGVLQPVFPRGANFIDGAGLTGSTGIYFSSLDVNLFHLTDKGSTETTHGRPQVFNNSSDSTLGGNSLIFGFGNATDAGRQAGNWTGTYDVPSLYDSVRGPGGARGAVESKLIDLTKYSADDQPYLYFNYRLNAENGNSSKYGDLKAALDTFRVYGAGEDGQWILLGTNNSADDNSGRLTTQDRINFSSKTLTPGSDEFDPANSGDVDAYGRNIIASELFSVNEWRQGRLSLAALAGKRDVKIRFEYATSGDFRSGDAQKGGVELDAVPGERIKDGDTFTVLNNSVGTPKTFEFDLGLVLNLPSGKSIQAGDQIKIGTAFFTFSNVAGATNIPFQPTDTPAALAAKVAAVLTANQYTVVTSTSTANVLNVTKRNGIALTDSASPNDYRMIGADQSIVIGRPGIQAGNVRVTVDNSMTAIAVRDAIRTSLAGTFNVAGQTANIDVYRVRGNTILLHDSLGLTVTSAGPLTLQSQRIGDQFGPLDAAVPRFSAALGAQNNQFNGVQIDDIIIGFAERGEAIFNTAGLTGSLDFFEDTRYYEPKFTSGPAQQQLETGTYQLEIRTAADYGVDVKKFPGKLYFVDPSTNASIGRTFNTNDRLTKSYTLTVGKTSSIRDGDTFTLSDGVNLATFEFDLTTSLSDRAVGVQPGNIAIKLSPNSSSAEIARAIRDAINAAPAQSIIQITAENGGDMSGASGAATGARSAIIQLNGNAAGTQTGSLKISATTIPLTLSQNGLDTTFGQDLGDGNILRDQGQFIVSSSSITDSLNFGISLGAVRQNQVGLSALAGARVYPGAVRDLITLNSATVSAGAVVMNNVIARNGTGGISVNGLATSAANGPSPNSLARLMNNTLYGKKSGDVGISVGDGVEPFILNNIIANFGTDIQVSATNTVGPTVNANIFQSNSVHNVSVAQSNSILLNPSDPLFIDGSKGLFYLKTLSQAIDSSISAISSSGTMDQLETVKTAVGLPFSPIIAPAFDVNGLRRSDDPLVSTPSGLGGNVFIDRGAIDRVDFVGPNAILQTPQDNDSNGLDTDPSDTYVRLNSGNYDFFEVLLDERQGIGTDANSVTSEAVILTENGRPLLQGSDYIFGFSANSRTIRLTPLAGFWRRDSVYELTLINKQSFRIDTPSGSSIADGDTVKITTASGALVFEMDSGNGVAPGSIAVPFSATDSNGTVAARLFNAISVAGVKAYSIGYGTLTIEGVTAVSGLGAKSIAPIKDLAENELLPNRANSLTQFTIVMPEVSVDYGDAIERPGLGSSSTTLADNGVRHALYPDDVPILALGQFADGDIDGTPSAAADGDDFGSSVVFSTGLPVALSPQGPAKVSVVYSGYEFGVPVSGAAVVDGTTFRIVNPAGVSVDFEFDKNGASTPGNRAIPISNASTQAQVATAIATAIATSALGISPTIVGTSIRLNEPLGSFVSLPAILPLTGATSVGKTFTISDAVNKTVTYQFTDATHPAIGTNVAVSLSGTLSNVDAANRLQAAIFASILAGSITDIHSIVTGNVISLGGTISHRFDVSASGSTVQRVAQGALGLSIPANVSSLAQGQTLTIQDGSAHTVTFQIVDASAVTPIALNAGNIAISFPNLTSVTQTSFAAAIAKGINDAIAAGKLHLPTATIVNNTINVSANDEDGVVFDGLFNADTPPVLAHITSTDTGFIDAWVDWNQDNDFNDPGEQILTSAAVLPGVNTFSIVTPVGTLPGYTTARFRLSATGGLFTYGLAVGGEVEDHVIEIVPGKPPIAVNDPDTTKAAAYRVDEDTVLNVSQADGVLFNDTDPDGSPFTVFDSFPLIPGLQPLVAPQNGTLVLNADGSFQYTPSKDFFGKDTFVYQVTDPRMVGNQPATVTITVNPINDVPFAADDKVDINEDIAQTWNGSLFTANDFAGVTTVPPTGLVIPNESNQNLKVKSVQLIDAAGAVVGPRIGEVLSLSNNVISYRPGSNYNNLINGPVRIKLQIEDDGVSGFSQSPDPLSAFSTLTVNIAAVNDRPIFTLPTNTINLTEDPTPPGQVFTNFATNVFAGPIQDIANGIGAADDELGNVVGLPGQNVTFSVRPLDPTRFTASGQPTMVRVGTNATFSFTLAPDVNSVNSGPILVEVIANDGATGLNLSLPQTITINVDQVNDPPEFTISTDNFTTTEDALKTVITGFLSNVAPGPSTAVDELSLQTTTRTVVAKTPAFYSSQPRLTATGDLEFQLAPNVNSLFADGTLTSLDIVVTVTDNGTPIASTSKTLTITATPINDQPTFVLNKTQITVSEDNEALNSLTETVELGLARNLVAGPTGAVGVGAVDENGGFDPRVPGQTFTFANVSITNRNLFSQLPSIDGAGNLTFKTAPDQNGTSIVVVRLTDNGVAGPPPNSNLGPTATFTITITPVNDAPEFSIPASTTVNEDQGIVSLPGFATGIRPGPATALDENNQGLFFNVVAEDPSLFTSNGQPTIQTDGTLVFQTAKDVNNNTAGVISRRILVTLQDRGLGAPPPNTNISPIQIFTINILPVNDPPLPGVTLLQGTEDTVMAIDASSVTNNVEPGPEDEKRVEGQTVRMTQIERTTINGGIVTPEVDAQGKILRFTYQPGPNFVGDDFILYVVTDNGTPEQSSTGTITIHLAPVNDPPQFVPGADVTVQEDSPAYSANWATGILAGPPNATDEILGLPPVLPQTVSFFLTTNNDSLFAVRPSVSPTGVLTFTLAKDANGRAIVDVMAIDSGSSISPNVNQSVVSKLTIVANAVNDAPGFNIISDIAVDEDSGRFTGVNVKDIVPAAGMNSSPKTGLDEVGQLVTLVTTNNNNSLFSVQPVINAAGVLEFVPAQDAFGTAVVSVVAEDNGPNTPPNVNQSAPKLFTIVIRPVNDAPVGVNDRYTTGEDVVLTVAKPGVLTNDRDVDFPNDLITVDNFQVTSAMGAVVSVLPDGSFTYDSRNAVQVQQLVDGQTASDTFTYTVRDRAGLVSNLATVTIVVSGTNDAPVAVNDSFSVPFNTTQLLNVLANDKDVDTGIDPRTIEIGQLVANGTATVLSTGRIEYKPNLNYRGTDSFTYRVRDALGAISNEALVTIVVNTAPVAVDDNVVTTLNTPISIDILRNDSDPDGTINRNSITIASGPDVGTAKIQSNGTILFTPPTGFVGIATFKYAVVDNDGLSSNLATVSVRVTKSTYQNPVNNLDVNNDGSISPIDVLIVVNDINFNGSRTLPVGLIVPPYLDVDGDGGVGPLDVLALVNYINTKGGAGAGEGEGSMATLGYSQPSILMLPGTEVIRTESELRTQVAKTVDAIVGSVGNVPVYGPALPLFFNEAGEEESFEAYLASLASNKSKRSDDVHESVFADLDWM